MKVLSDTITIVFGETESKRLLDELVKVVGSPPTKEMIEKYPYISELRYLIERKLYVE